MVKHVDGIAYYSTWDLIKRQFFKNKQFKDKISLDVKLDEAQVMPSLTHGINHIAIVLDGEVQEIMRAQNRLAALLLSEPKFIEFDPDEVVPEIGWKYENQEFISGE
jgi:hypothetical protein